MVRECDRDDVDELLARINATDDWIVRDWDFSAGMYDAGKVTISVKWQPKLSDEKEHAVRDLIERLENDNEDGAPIDDVLSKADDPETAEKVIEKMRQQGELYKPTSGFVRTT
jgi:DNA replicative helicase MCM subunit Mcm2 (Cdc46/Mcm family)